MIATTKNHLTQIRALNDLADRTLTVYDEETAEFKKDPFNCKGNLLNVQACIVSLKSTKFLPVGMLKKYFLELTRALQAHDVHAIHNSREAIESSFINAGYLRPITAYPSDLSKSHP